MSLLAHLAKVSVRFREQEWHHPAETSRMPAQQQQQQLWVAKFVLATAYSRVVFFSASSLFTGRFLQLDAQALAIQMLQIAVSAGEFCKFKGTVTAGWRALTDVPTLNCENRPLANRPLDTA